ncbi:signal peptide peptidase SppA [Mycolicibacterium parafortuitum]|uniref:Signal peptide peptidase SppA n=1 Tax=Mycolicibacterium parafortuitum TaxID=39692 RepID=A0A7I7TY16_MYCPF|nr:signal peptide peptidase SppA [Mycolicibacterium parafortuitum]PQE00281.1 signal peptide peptidase SppA [Mycobacterium sp. EPG1]BBY73319.1 signal peptide peptidase SppA [Mycolicibacterium parafortuitum]
MFALLSGVPGFDEVRQLARKVDTARHQGVPDGCILELDLRTAPPESAGFDPVALLNGAGRPLLLREAIAALHRAADDPRVAGLIARVQIDAAPPGPVQELREAIEAFTAKKPSLAWAETYPGTLSYYLASAFGEVWMQPSGTVGLVGFATNALFLRDALDKLGVEAQFIAMGEYKSAPNLFTEHSYTQPHREADTALVTGLRTQVWEAVARSRGIDAAALDALADRAPLLRDDAVTAKLIDRVGFRDEAYARIEELACAKRAAADDAGEDDEAPRLYLHRYARTKRPSVPGLQHRQRIAVVTVAGPIVSGRGGRQMSPRGGTNAGGDTIAAALREAAADDDVAAVVLRVDSPGGSVTASETIWREVVRTRESGTPVVASMGAVAASGGYYVSMAADAIVANPATITGSIGVVTGKFVARDLKDRLGVGSDSVKTNANADAWSINAPFTEEQHAQVSAEAELFYRDFLERVAAGRDMTVEAVEKVARGRVWTGADAHERGLVDELGGLRTAIRRAKALAGIDEHTKVGLQYLPSASLRDVLRPKPSSQPAAASLTELVGGLAIRSLAEVVDQTQRSLTGVNALWLGESRFS